MTPRPRQHQQGSIIERSGSFYVRYYTTDRKRRAEFLCHKEGRFKSATAKAVRDLAADKMREVNKGVRSNSVSTTVTDFWETVYLPWCRENLRASTVAGYVKTWDYYLADHFTGRALGDYKPADASGMMTTWAKTGRKGKGLGRASIGHIRSLGSGIFAHAVKTGVIDRNPWSDAGVLTKLKGTAPTVAYTIDEAKAILTALASRLDAQCVFGLAFFMGLRPSEIAGLRWPDITGGVLHIRRAAVQGVVDETKTHSSVRDLPIIEPLGAMLEAWRSRCGYPDDGYVFPTSRAGRNGGVDPIGAHAKDGGVHQAGGRPLNVESLCLHTIKPLCKAAGIAFCGLYAARRGHGTVMTRLASLTAARQTLGHSSELVTAQHYALKDQIAGDAGLKVLEATYEHGHQQDTSNK